MSNRARIEQRVIQAAESALQNQHYVSPIDVLLGMGLLQFVHVQDWLKGRIPYLEKVIQGNLSKISYAMKCFRSWANKKGLKPSQTIYLARTKGPKRELQFSKSRHPTIEKAYQTHYISPFLSEKKQQRLKEKLDKPPELVVFITISDSQCSQCKKEMPKGCFIFMEADQPLCLSCAGFAELVFLPRGDAKLTRYARKYSTTSIVAVKFSRARKRYERQGIMVQQEAIQKAESEIEDNEITIDQ
jgi:hypothetical protein